MLLYSVLLLYPTLCDTNVNNNNNHFFSANILEDRAQWRDKSKGLSKLIIENNARVVNGWMKKLGG